MTRNATNDRKRSGGSGRGPMRQQITAHALGHRQYWQPARDGTETFGPGELPAGPPGPWYDYTRRTWVFPAFDEAVYGRAAQRPAPAWDERRR